MSEQEPKTEAQNPQEIEHNRTTRRFFDSMPISTFERMPQELLVITSEENLNSTTERLSADRDERRNSQTYLDIIAQRFNTHLTTTSHLTTHGISHITKLFKQEQRYGVSGSDNTLLQSQLHLSLPEDKIKSGGIHNKKEALEIEIAIFKDALNSNTKARNFARREYIKMYGDQNLPDGIKAKNKQEIIDWEKALNERGYISET